MSFKYRNFTKTWITKRLSAFDVNPKSWTV